MAGQGECIIFCSGKRALFRIKRGEVGSFPSGWTENGWAYKTEAQILSGITIKVGGTPIGLRRIPKISVDRSINPNASILDPHVMDNDFGTSENYLEFMVDLTPADYIVYGAAVTWSMDADLFVEAGTGNGAVTDATATNKSLHERTTRTTSGFPNLVNSDCDGVYISTSGSMPRLPRITNTSPDDSWTTGSTITPAEVNGNANALFIVRDLTLDLLSATGVVFEVGDISGGVSVIYDGTYLYVKAGDSTTAVTVKCNVDKFPGLFPKGYPFDLGIHLKGAGGIDVYVEGHVVTSGTGDCSAWINATTNGAYAAASGDYINSDLISPAPTNADITFGGDLEYYSNPTITLAVDGSSRDWFPFFASPFPVSREVWAIYNGKPWESELTKYIYTKSDFADMQHPGTINVLSDIRIAGEIYGSLGAGSDWFVAIKHGDTFTTFDETRPGGAASDMFDKPGGTDINNLFVVLGYGDFADGAAHIDLSATGGNTKIIKWPRNFVIEPGALEISGNGNETKQVIDITATGYPANSGAENIYIGGIKINNWGTHAFNVVGPDNITDGDTSWQSIYLGLMCYNGVSDTQSRGAAFATGSPCYAYPGLQFIEHDVSLFWNSYDNGGFSNQQSHPIYIKGIIQHLVCDGGWFPGIAGAAIKSDTHHDALFDNFISWDHFVDMGFHFNGTDESGYNPAWSTTRAARQGGYNERVLARDFIGSMAVNKGIDWHSTVNCAARNAIIVGAGRSSTIEPRGTSYGEGKYGSDHYYTGLENCLLISTATFAVDNLMPVTDDRTLIDSIGNHECYLYRTIADGGVRFKSGVSQTYATAAAAGRAEDYRILGCHIVGGIEDGDGTAYIDMTDAIGSIADSNGEVFQDSADGALTYAGYTHGDDLFDVYVVGLGYASKNAARDAIAAAWNGRDWGDVPSGLAVEEIRAGISAMLVPTGLASAATYGGTLPGPPAAPDTAPTYVSSNPTNGATGVAHNQSTVVIRWSAVGTQGLASAKFYLHDAADDSLLATIPANLALVNALDKVEQTVTLGTTIGYGKSVYLLWDAGVFISQSGVPNAANTDKTALAFTTESAPGSSKTRSRDRSRAR